MEAFASRCSDAAKEVAKSMATKVSPVPYPQRTHQAQPILIRKTMNTKTSTRQESSIFNTPAQRQVNAPQRRTTPEPCPISDFESKF